MGHRMDHTHRCHGHCPRCLLHPHAGAPTQASVAFSPSASIALSPVQEPPSTEQTPSLPCSSFRPVPTSPAASPATLTLNPMLWPPRSIGGSPQTNHASLRCRSCCSLHLGSKSHSHSGGSWEHQVGLALTLRGWPLDHPLSREPNQSLGRCSAAGKSGLCAHVYQIRRERRELMST